MTDPNRIASIQEALRLSCLLTPFSKNEIQGIHGDALKVRLQAPSVEGKANQSLIRFLSDALDIPRAQISIASGETGRNKSVLITGISKTELLEKIGIVE